MSNITLLLDVNQQAIPFDTGSTNKPNHVVDMATDIDVAGKNQKHQLISLWQITAYVSFSLQWFTVSVLKKGNHFVEIFRRLKLFLMMFFGIFVQYQRRV